MQYEDDEGDRVLLTTDADLAGAVLHAKSSGLKVTLFCAFCDYLFNCRL
jgi:hypothetical protein